MKKQLKVLIGLIVFIACVLIFNTKANAATCTKTNSSNNSATFIGNLAGMNDSNTAIGISAANNGTAKYTYTYSELTPREFYSITAFVKVNSITCDEQDYLSGAIISISETPASSEIVKTVTNGWKKLSYVALSNENGIINAEFLLNNAKGEILFDNIELKEIQNDSNFVLYSYTNEKEKTARMVFPLEKVYGTPITKSEIDNWLKVILRLREYMTNFTGINVDNENVDVIATNYYGAYAYIIGGRTEIQWMQNCVNMNEIHGFFQQGADTMFFITHEMGHQHTAKESNFESEFLGTTLGLLACYNLNLKVAGLTGVNSNNIVQKDEIVQFCQNMYNQKFLTESTFYGDGLTYILFKTIFELNEKQSDLGWNSLKATLNYFKDSNISRPNGESFIVFVNKWTELSGENIKEMLYKNSPNDKNIIEDGLGIGKFKYYLNNDGETISVSNYSRTFEEFSEELFDLDIPSYIDGHKVTNIYNWGFANNDSIRKVKLPQTVEKLEGCAFYNCHNLEEFEIPKNSNLKEIKDWCVCENKMKEIFIPRSVIEIGDHSLYGDNTTIVGYSNSEAQMYANENDFTFKEFIDVFSISLDKTNITLKEEQTETINATINPFAATNKNIIWTSDDESIAKVTNGVITAKGVGTTVIRAETEDEGKVATCTVNVTELDRTNPEITIDKIIDNELYEVCLTVNDNSGIKSVEYKFDTDDEYMVLLARQDGKYYILPKNNGTYKVKVTDNEDNVKEETILIEDLVEQAYITKDTDEINDYIVKITTKSNNQVKTVKINNTVINKQENGEYIFKPSINGEYIIEVEYEDNSFERTVYNEVRFKNESGDNENDNSGNNEDTDDDNNNNNDNDENYGSEHSKNEEEFDEYVEEKEGENDNNNKENELENNGKIDNDNKDDDSKTNNDKTDNENEYYGSVKDDNTAGLNNNGNVNNDKNKYITNNSNVSKISANASESKSIIPKAGIAIIPILPIILALIIYIIAQAIKKDKKN